MPNVKEDVALFVLCRNFTMPSAKSNKSGPKPLRGFLFRHKIFLIDLINSFFWYTPSLLACDVDDLIHIHPRPLHKYSKARKAHYLDNPADNNTIPKK